MQRAIWPLTCFEKHTDISEDNNVHSSVDIDDDSSLTSVLCIAIDVRNTNSNKDIRTAQTATKAADHATFFEIGPVREW